MSLAEEIPEVSAEAWGHAALEEVLFRAARSLGAEGRTADVVEVSLSFRITAEPSGALLVAIKSETEGSITTRLDYPF
jgi:hypothetical protein